MQFFLASEHDEFDEFRRMVDEFNFILAFSCSVENACVGFNELFLELLRVFLGISGIVLPEFDGSSETLIVDLNEARKIVRCMLFRSKNNITNAAEDAQFHVTINLRCFQRSEECIKYAELMCERHAT